MFKGLLIYSSLLLFTILVALFITPKEAVQNIGNLSQGIKSVNFDDDHKQPKEVTADIDQSDIKLSKKNLVNTAEEKMKAPSLSKEMFKKTMNLSQIEADDDVVDSEMKAQVAAYMAGTSLRSKGDDFDVVSVEMVMSEDSYDKNSITKSEPSGFTLLEDFKTSDHVPVDLTIPDDVVSYQAMESERLYAEIKRLGKTQVNFEDP